MTKTRRWARIAAKSAAALTLAAIAVTALPILADADASEVKVTGTLPRKGPIYVDEASRLVYMVEDGSIPRVVSIRNADTLKPAGSVSFDVPAVSLALQYRGAGVHVPGTLAAVDGAHGRLFLPLRDAQANLIVGVVQGRTRKTSSFRVPHPAPLPAATPTAHVTIEAVAYEPSHDTLYVLAMLPVSSGTAFTNQGRISIMALDASDGALRWSRDLDPCSSLPIDTQYMPAFGASASAVYATCSAGVAPALFGFGVLPGDATLVVKIPLAADGSPQSIKPYLAPATSVRGVFDSKSERMMLVGVSVLLVFDGEHEVWAGLVPSGGRPFVGLSAGLGRVYLCTGQSVDPISKILTGGLAATDAAAAPQPPTIDEYPQIACTAEQTWAITADAKSRRVFVPGFDNTWRVVRDDAPAYKEPVEFDPDEGVVDLPEDPAKTDSTFAAQGSAYGTRVVVVGGPLGAMDNSASTTSSVLRQNGYRASLTIGESSREVRFANVPIAKLSRDGVEAAAIPADRDARAEGDLQTLRNYQHDEENRSGRAFDGIGSGDDKVLACTESACTIKNTSKAPVWPYEPSSCAAFGGGTDVAKGKEQPGASATCDFEHSAVKAHAQSDKYDVLGLVTVGDSSATVEVTRDPVKGVVSKAISIARNISIANVIRIAEATATVESRANGHRNGATADTYSRTFRGVAILGANGQPVYSCETVQQCDPAGVLEAANRVLGPRIRMRLPDPDRDLLKGTAKGTSASFRQEFWDQVQERVLFDKPSEDLTMAALEIQVNANLRASSGLIVQFAGVTTSALYQIFKKPEPIPVPTLPIPTFVAPTVSVTLPPEAVPPPAQPKIVTKLVTDRARIGTRLLFGFAGRPALVLLSWGLFLGPMYLGVRRALLIRTTRRAAS